MIKGVLGRPRTVGMRMQQERRRTATILTLLKNRDHVYLILRVYSDSYSAKNELFSLQSGRANALQQMMC